MFTRRLCWIAIPVLLIAAALGGARVYRASVLSAPINDGVSSEIRIGNALELTRRVAARFKYIEEHGALGTPAPWPLRTEADHLLTGGDCGAAAAALGTVFVSRGRPFRILQANVGAGGAGHIMFETPDDSGRWVLLDPIEGHGFPRPSDGRLLGIEEIRALPESERTWLPEPYRDGEYSLYAPYRRTNWARLGVMANLVRTVEGDAWMNETSVRVAVLEADRNLTAVALFALAMIAVIAVAPRLRRGALPRS